jgi:hypothetical protein
MCLSCTLAKEVHLFLALGVYTGIFALYLQCPLKESRTAMIVFYVLCLLYALSIATVAMDLLEGVLEVSNNSIRKIIIIQMRIVDMHYGLSFKMTHCQCCIAFILSK